VNKTKKVSACSLTQQRYLLQEVERATRGMFWSRNDPGKDGPVKPQAVRDYERRVELYRKSEVRRRDQNRRRFQSLINKTKEAILFGTSKQALAAVDKLRNSIGNSQ
jgi:hypothetical protein